MVCRCRKISTGEKYAMKIQSKDGLINNCDGEFSRLVLEKQALAMCSHPYVVSLGYAFQTESLLMMVMELGIGM